MEHRTISKKNIIHNILVAGFLIIIYLAPLLFMGGEGKKFVCILSFLVNGFIFIVGIFSAKNKHSISMELVYWIFMFFFMYFAPLIQYRLNIFPWNGAITKNEILYANLIILLFNLCFAIGSFLAQKIKIIGIPNFGVSRWLSAEFELQNKSKIIFTILVCLLTIYSLSQTGLQGIIASRADATQAFYSGQNSSIELIVESVVPAFITYIVADAAQGVANRKEKGIRFLLLFCCLLICFFPTTIPRYKAATIYGVVFLTLFPWFSKGSRFFWIFITGLFFIFPLFKGFRYVISNESIQQIFNMGFFESYTEGDYDAYRMLVSSIRYVSVEGSTLGHQLLGVILFFVPRSVWLSKPIGSGATLITNEFGNNVFSNVSCPYIAEGFINFGIFGVILFAMLLGVFISKIDKKYWDDCEENKKRGLFSPYLFLVFMLFFVMRGDLLSGFAYACGFVVTGLILSIFSKRTNLH